MAAPVLYAVVNLIALQMAADSAGSYPRADDPFGDLLLGPLDRELGSARVWTFCFAVILAAEAACLAALHGRLNRRPGVAAVLPRAVAGVGYLLSLALVVEINPTSPFLELNDDSALDRLVPSWHFPALVAVGVVTLVAVAAWLVGARRDDSAS
ncbi:hypothetical protein Nocox_16295 [Nonomuraea coxensis DSM 45129]|uniref:Uncharacterized protein n=1 Tax=Nonomuraea coxensis DSM 45129 TaxID=1122611 RepID=A0ABX8U2K6_9ACTN|nr:hypothetical protein [Nonomuraea coxensis]QYC40872.1 hypothetical protein Nocox_16295 [Nonomuraea coxensis DSM 45129]